MATDPLIEELGKLMGAALADGFVAYAEVMREAASTLTSQAQQIAQLREVVQSVIDDVKEQAQDLIHDAADWREMSDRTGGHAAGRLVQDAVANEGAASRLHDYADRLESALSALPARPTASAPPAYGWHPDGSFVDSSGVSTPRWQSPIPGKGEGDSLQARAEALWIQIRPPRDRRSAQWFGFDDRAVEQIVIALQQERR